MIEPTDEMVTAAAEVAEEEMIRRLGRDLGTIHRDDIIRAILAAGLALVERDYRLDRVCREELVPGVHCVRPAHVRGEHEAKMPTGSTVAWS
jgi:hypothetical protein